MSPDASPLFGEWDGELSLRGTPPPRTVVDATAEFLRILQPAQELLKEASLRPEVFLDVRPQDPIHQNTRGYGYSVAVVRGLNKYFSLKSFYALWIDDREQLELVLGQWMRLRQVRSNYPTFARFLVWMRHDEALFRSLPVLAERLSNRSLLQIQQSLQATCPCVMEKGLLEFRAVASALVDADVLVLSGISRYWKKPRYLLQAVDVLEDLDLILERLNTGIPASALLDGIQAKLEWDQGDALDMLVGVSRGIGRYERHVIAHAVVVAGVAAQRYYRQHNRWPS